MKKILLVICISTLFSCTKEKNETIEENTSEWNEFKLKGKVEKIFSEYKSDFDNIENISLKYSLGKNEEKTFDNKGRLTSMTTFQENGDIFEKRVFNGKNFLIEHQQFLKGKLFMKTLYTWDENDQNTIVTKRDSMGNILDKTINVIRDKKVIEKKVLRSAGAQIDYTITYEYDKNNLKIGEKKYDRYGKLKTQTKFRYNDKGQIISEAKSDEAGTYTLQTDYEYDTFGRQISIKSFSNSPNQFDYEEYKQYNDEGQILNIKIIDHNVDEVFTELYSYDEFKNLVEIKSYSNETLKSKTEFQFNEHGLLIEKVTIDDKENKTLTSNEYLLDEIGNWITQKTTINGEFAYQINRTITYF